MFLLYFFAGLLVFFTIFLAVDFMSVFSNYSVPTRVIIEYYSYSAPVIVYQMIPVACLLGTVFAISSLNRSSELVALFSLGLSLARICAPILIIVSSVSAFSYWLSDRILPQVMQKKNYLYYVEIRNRPALYSTVKTDKIWYRSENVLFNIKTLSNEAKLAQGLTLYYFDPSWNLIQLMNAESVELGKKQWTLKDGSVTLFTEESSFPYTQSFKTKVIDMDEEIADLQSTARSMDTLNVSQLKKFIRKNKESGLDTLHYEVDYHSKYSYAFAAFVMSLMGIPFSVSRQRSGGMFFNAGMCVLLAFLYWSFYSATLSMGKHGTLPPVLAAWLPNVFVIAGSVYLLSKLKK